MIRRIIALIFVFVMAMPALCFGVDMSAWSRKTEIAVSHTEAVDAGTIELNAWYNSAQITDQGSFEWFANPVIRYKGTYDRTYIGYYKGDDEKTVIRYWDAGALTLSNEVDIFTSFGDGDDHSCPTIIILRHQTGDNASHNGKLIISDAEHGGAAKLRRSTKVEDVSAWDAAVTIAADNASYLQIVETSDGTLWAFYRITNSPTTDHMAIYYTQSTDAGTTWGDVTLLWDGGPGQSYVMIDTNSNDSEIHLMFNHNIIDEPSTGYRRYRDIYHCYYDVSETKWNMSDGTDLTLPMDVSTEGSVPTMVHDTADNHWEFLWDIQVIDGTPYLLSCDEVPSLPAHADGNVFLHTWSGSAWSTETVCGTGVFGTYAYQAGAIIDETDPYTIYACVPDGSGLTQLQQWKKSGTWSKTEDITQASPGDNYRPMYVQNGGDLFKVLWCYTENYSMYSDGNWEASLFAYPGYNNGRNLKIGKCCRTDFGDIRFTDSSNEYIGYEGKGWIESKTDSWKATIKLRIDDVPASPDTVSIYAYFGNAAATYPETDTEEVNATKGDEAFSDEFTGEAINTNYWTVEAGSPSVSDGTLILSDDDSVVTKSAYGLGYEFRARAKVDEQDVYFLFLTESTSNTNNVQALTNSDGTYADDFDRIRFISVEDSSQTDTENDSWSDIRNTYYEYYITRTSTSSTTYGQGSNSNTFTTSNRIPDGNTYLRFNVWDSSQESTLTVDWMEITKILPTVTASALETESALIPISMHHYRMLRSQ